MEGVVDWDGEMGDVIVDTNGEAIPDLLRIEEVIDGFDVLWLGILGG